VTLSWPTGNFVVVKTAFATVVPVFGSTPPVTATAGASCVAPAKNATAPVGRLPLLLVLTVAVNVTLAPGLPSGCLLEARSGSALA
jgi:hypothetical protein